ncbi:MAG: antibiotic biosynthesis monooxygenase [bacterium]
MYRYIWKIKLNNPEDEQAFIDHWRESSKILQEYPGASGTHVHSVRDEPGCYFAVAEWESQEARDAMSDDTDEGTSDKARRWQKFAKNESFGEIINFAGQEIDVVLPE